jgi:hypothetical protein
MSADMSARTVRQADGLDPVRALQRVLYRSAKQDRTRRFHALFDKLARCGGFISLSRADRASPGRSVFPLLLTGWS